MNKILASCISTALLVGCLDNNDTINNQAKYEGAAIITISDNYQSSDLVTVDSEYESTENLYPQAYSDVSFSGGEDSVYMINKFGANNILKYSQETLGEVVWQYSTNDTDIANQESNPYQVIEASNNTAYVLRFGAGEVWQINTNAETESEFKVAEIDLSEFDDDGIPDMSAAILKDGILYIALQRLTFFSPLQDSLLVAIDTQNNELVDLSPNDDATLALTLQFRNPKEILSNNDKLYVTSTGQLSIAAWGVEAIHTGGIEIVDLTSLNSQILIDNSDLSTYPYGQSYSVAIYGDDIVFTGYNSEEKIDTYLKAGSSAPVFLDSSINGMDVRFAKFDAEGQLWVGIGDKVDPRTLVYTKNASDEYEVTQTVYTTLLPNEIIFN